MVVGNGYRSRFSWYKCLACLASFNINIVFVITSTAYLNKKRKLQDELQEMPLPKHVCWDQSLESDSLLDSSTEPKKVQSNNFARGGESDTESAKDKTSAGSYERTSSSVSWADSSSEVGLYSSNSTSLTKLSCSEPESISITEQLDRADSQYGLGPSLNYDCSEYRNEDIEQRTEKELENLLHSNGVAPGNYVLSSGRWSVNQDTQHEGKKLTIDKEFEQYFAMLML
ncbi:protein FAR-RED ELONGATED HYPOCOTYL 1 [Sesamum angolense]|uniref:Protein FAR-RED ELONGATED HYPOCOTYL 1 n=1 Tax=Sesamum angolense TaxID=2727404 RepID=A0AAE2BNY8_9LAMI|nr:protein FAR-RED ELONGATED HYPOCOTYL 1 [Sesamum angolense]